MSDRILQPGRNCMGVYGVRGAGVLIDGRDFYRAFHTAASRARRTIMMTGWQFDSTVRLLRGDDIPDDDEEPRLFKFLNSLCERNSELHVYLLAWDFSRIIDLEREWFQDWLFKWKGHERVQFLFDANHPVGGCHHHKCITIDGQFTFVGGMDICENRWDTRDHMYEDPLRVNTRGEPYEPYHDIQSCVTGPVARELGEMFVRQWREAGGGDIELPDFGDEDTHDYGAEPTVPLTCSEVGVSRTVGMTLAPKRDQVEEVRQLFTDAIRSARRLIYMENQYYSSRAIYEALRERLHDESMPPLELVFICPKDPHTFFEEVAIGSRQNRILRTLREEGAQRGHHVGVYYRMTKPNGGRSVPTYIHAKFMAVDDRLMTVGSANCSNRSMGLDTELNLVWESGTPGDGPATSIRRVRESLLAEHTGEDPVDMPPPNGGTLVEYLDEVASREDSLLRRHELKGPEDDLTATQWIDPEDIPMDPERPILEDSIKKLMEQDTTGMLAEGVGMVEDLLDGKALVDVEKPMSLRRRLLLIGLALLVLAAVAFAVYWLMSG